MSGKDVTTGSSDTRAGERLAARFETVPGSLVGVLAVGTFLRLYQLGAESFWVDEFRSLQYVTTRTPLEVVTEIPRFDPHPPLYYLLLDLWTGVVGVSEPDVRLLSVVFGVAAIPALYAFGAELYDRPTGVLAAAILALSGFHIRFSQTARMYSLLVFAAIVSMYCLVRLEREPNQRTTLAYVGASVVLVYTHVFGLLVVAAQHSYVLSSWMVREDGRTAVSLRRWFAIHAGIMLAAVPWGVAITQQAMETVSGTGSGLAWIPEPTVGRLVRAIGSYLAPSLESGLVGALALGVVAVLALGSRSRVSLDGERTLLLAAWVVVPVAGLFVVSTLVTPLFVPRYTSAALPAVALVLSKEGRRIRSVEIRYVVGAIVLVTLAAGVVSYYQAPQHTEWREASAVVEGGDDAVVLVHLGHAAETFGHYVHRDHPTLPVEPVAGGASATTIRDDIRTRDEVWLALTRASDRQRARMRRLLSRAGFGARATHDFHGVTVVHYTRTGTGQS